jgi:hypothetical protein
MQPILASCERDNHSWSVTEETCDPSIHIKIPAGITCSACGAWRQIDVKTPEPELDPETEQFLKDTSAWIDW